MSVNSWLVTFILFFSGAIASNTHSQAGCDPKAPAFYKNILVLDAGSSGIRCMQYKLTKEGDDPLFNLHDQSYMIERPPLELDTPIPPSIARFTKDRYKHNQSSGREGALFLGATAGLRAMSGMEAKKILVQKAEQISELGVPAKFNQNVRLLTGLEEGVYTWFGVNSILRAKPPKTQLMDVLNTMAHHHESQFGIIEIGGGSVQVGFSIPHNFEHQHLRRDQTENKASDIPNVKRLHLPNDLTLDIYSKSLHHSGLNSTYKLFSEQFLEYPASNPCLNRNLPVTDEATKEFFSAHGDYRHCKDAIDHLLFTQPQAAFNGAAVVDKKYRDKLPRQFFLTGYFFDKTAAKGLPEKLNLTLLEEAAEHACNMNFASLYFLDLKKEVFSSFMTGKPYFITPMTSLIGLWKGGKPRTGDLDKYCMHLTYISLLLKKIGITPDYDLYTRKHLTYQGNTFGVSWPLGYAILSANNWL